MLFNIDEKTENEIEQIIKKIESHLPNNDFMRIAEILNSALKIKKISIVQINIILSIIDQYSNNKFVNNIETSNSKRFKYKEYKKASFRSIDDAKKIENLLLEDDLQRIRAILAIYKSSKKKYSKTNFYYKY